MALPTAINQKKGRTFKSLNEVKNTYFPNKKLEFLEGETDLTREAFMKILQQVARPAKQVVEEKK